MYVKVENGLAAQFPFNPENLRHLYPNTGFPKPITDNILSEYDVFPVHKTSPPQVSALQYTQQSRIPIWNETSERWETDWLILDKSTKNIHEELNFERLRRIEHGSSFAVTGYTDPIPLTGRSFDQTVYLGLMQRAQAYKAAGVTDSVMTIRDRNDNIQNLTPDQMIELITLAMTWIEDTMAVSWAMKDGTAPFDDGVPIDYTDDKYWP
jgi:hypothetical protein